MYLGGKGNICQAESEHAKISRQKMKGRETETETGRQRQRDRERKALEKGESKHCK